MRALWVLGLASLLLGGGCSDDDAPPASLDGGASDGSGESLSDDGLRPGEAGGGDHGVLVCQGNDPCVEELAGEGQHIQEMLVIGEILTLRGANLGSVDAVYLGAASAPLISVGDSEVRCRVAPGTPSGEASVEIKTGTLRRKFPGVTIRRLLLVAAADDSELVSFDAVTHTAGPIVTLSEAPSRLLGVTPSGRYALLVGDALLVVDLARELVAPVSGISGAEVSGWAAAGEHDALLLLATAAGELLSVDLTAFPSLAAQAVSDAPAAVSLLGVNVERIAGLTPAAQAQQGSVWSGGPDGSEITWAEQDGSPFTLGSGNGLAPLAADRAASTLAFLARQGNQPQLAVLSEQAGILEGQASLAAPGARGLAVAAGGGHVALSGTVDPPALSYYPLAGTGALAQVSLPGSGAQGLAALRLPALPDLVAVLTGPAAEPLVGSAVELVDLAQGVRLTSGGGAALTMGDLRAAVGDPVGRLLHLLRGGELRSFRIAVTDGEATLSEEHPRMYLTEGRDHRWLAVQP